MWAVFALEIEQIHRNAIAFRRIASISLMVQPKAIKSGKIGYETGYGGDLSLRLKTTTF